MEAEKRMRRRRERETTLDVASGARGEGTVSPFFLSLKRLRVSSKGLSYFVRFSRALVTLEMR